MPQTIVPFIGYEDAVAAIDWLTEAFGFRENAAQRFMDGKRVSHAELDVGDGSVIFVATPSAEYESPKHHRGHCETAARSHDNPWINDGNMVQVEDVDAHHDRARAAGAVILRPPEDSRATGGRQYSAEDLEGHRWMFMSLPKN